MQQHSQAGNKQAEETILVKYLVTRSMVTIYSIASGCNSQQKTSNLPKSWETKDVHTIMFFLIITKYLFTNYKLLLG